MVVVVRLEEGVLIDCVVVDILMFLYVGLLVVVGVKVIVIEVVVYVGSVC